MPVTIRRVIRTEDGGYRVAVDYTGVRGIDRRDKVITIPASQARNAGEVQAAIRAAVIADAQEQEGRRPPAVPAPIKALEGQTFAEE